MDRPHHLGKPVTEPGAAATEPAPPEPEPKRYDLFLRHRSGFFWRLTDEGIVPGPDRLSFPTDGRMGHRRYEDIDRVNLSVAHIPRSGSLAQCGIVFRNGATLGLSTANAQGLPDPLRRDVYHDFLEDFHRRLIVSGAAKSITFTRGGTQTRMLILQIALIAGTGLFVVLPVVLAVIARSWEPFQLMLMGALLLWPAWETAQKNQPGTYSPKYPPDLLD
jgi:hypothetical protein